MTADVSTLLQNLGPGETTALFGQAEHTGIGYLQVVIPWDQVEPKPGVWDFSATDTALAVAQRAHLRVLAVLADTPAWASTCPSAPQPSACPPRQASDFTTYVTTLAKRYPMTITAWQVLGDPGVISSHGWTPGVYAELLGTTHAAVHHLQAHAVVLSVPMLGGVWAEQSAFLASLIRDSHFPYFSDIDALGVDARDLSPAGVTALLQKAHAQLSQDRSPEIWVDFGYPALASAQHLRGYTGGEQGQATYLVDAFRAIIADPTVTHVFWSQLADTEDSQQLGLFALPAPRQFRGRRALAAYTVMVVDHQPHRS